MHSRRAKGIAHRRRGRYRFSFFETIAMNEQTEDAKPDVAEEENLSPEDVPATAAEEASPDESSAEEAPAEETPPEVDFDYVDLMLDGDLKAQVNYSLVKAIAAALDEKVRLLEREALVTSWEDLYSGGEGKWNERMEWMEKGLSILHPVGRRRTGPLRKKSNKEVQLEWELRKERGGVGGVGSKGKKV